MIEYFTYIQHHDLQHHDLPSYIPKNTSELKYVCLKSDFSVVFESNLSVMNFLNSGNDKTSYSSNNGAFQIQYSCENYCVCRTHQNLRTLVQQHKERIEKALKFNDSSSPFDSALRN